ncbi:MAG: peptidase dimerization domain-containing protein [Spirochaetia bacterium]|jgi:di/tripeptidase|nr:peptidase dimerization domain-containing protein [Spirochaetia bacterium]
MTEEKKAKILADLIDFDPVFLEIKELFLSNLVMISEIPAPTFEEQERVGFLLNKFSEANLINTSTDEYGNALGILPGTEEGENILIVSNIDTSVDFTADHSVSVGPGTVTGPAVGNNAVGLAAITILPALFEKLGITLKSNLILMGSSRSLGKGSLGGLRFFLKNTRHPIKAGICLEGMNLGEISHRSLGMMRCEIIYNTPDNFDWRMFGRIGAIETLSEIISRIREIPIPGKPRTSVSFASIESGTAYSLVASEGILRFEIRSESEEMVIMLKHEIQNIVAEVSSSYGIEVTMDVVGQRNPGGIPFTHPLITSVRDIMEALDIKTTVQPTTNELSAFIDIGIPAVTIGITNGSIKDKNNEEIEIGPVSQGLKTLLGLILSVDREEYDES